MPENIPPISIFCYFCFLTAMCNLEIRRLQLEKTSNNYC